MTLSYLTMRLVLWAAASLVVPAALAQVANYTSVEVTSDKPMQLSYHASVHKNCTPAPLPTVRVIEAPKSGTLTVRKALLTTDKVAECPAVKIPAQVVFYRARTDATGTDHLVYEVKDPNGETGTYDVTINIKNPPVQIRPSSGSKI